MNKIPFNRPFIIGRELEYIAQAVSSGHLAGDGMFTKKCNQWLENQFSANKVLLTHSCTAALEMSAILCNIGPGDEVIMPSFTFVSTANAFALRGAKIRFVDIRMDTLNIDESKIEEAVTPRTKAIVPVHYAGVGCEMDTILEIARRHGLFVVEDAAQGFDAAYKGKYLGTIGHLGAFSFHETKNVISGEGGALLVNDTAMIERAEIIREKGTNRSKFFRGEIDKYTWVDIGSSYLPSEVVAAFLFAQLEKSQAITDKRKSIYRFYKESLKPLEEKGLMRLPICPDDCKHNAHCFYVLVKSSATQRNLLLAHLKSRGIGAVFHYIPLHSSPMGERMGCGNGDFPVTEDLSAKLIRLPCFYELGPDKQNRVIDEIFSFFRCDR
jgi:dTDP-4-amino-4,6-dideoxygalactose transaminase